MLKPDPYSSPRIKELLQAANDAARLFRTTYLALTLLTLYLFLTTLSATDEILFTDGHLQASPVLNVSVRASSYFMAAPWLLLLVHFHFLTLGVFLARKIGNYRRALALHTEPSQQDEMLRLLFPIPLTHVILGRSSLGVLHGLLRVSVFFALVVLPIFTIGLIETQFLRFQSNWITWMHSGVLVLDLLLIWHLWPQVTALYAGHDNSRHRSSSIAVTVLMGAVFLGIAHLLPYSHSLHSLDVRNKRLYLDSAARAPSDACNDDTLALNLSGRSYKYAQMSDAVLCNAILTNTYLQGADVRNAQLQGANMVGAFMQRANFAGAQLQGAEMNDAKLHGAILRNAQLQGAVLYNARLHKAQLQGAQLQAASLDSAQLVAADLRGAQLQGADLSTASLQGAELWETGFQGADIREAQFQGARSTQSFYTEQAQRFRIIAVAVVAGIDPESELGMTEQSFNAILGSRQDKESELSGAIVAGGRSQGQVDADVEVLRRYVAESRVENFRERMAPHVEGEIVYGDAELFRERGAAIGAYNGEQASRWIHWYKRECCGSFGALRAMW